MENKIYGYIRVSTKEQNEDRQVIALSKYGIPRKQIYMDTLSGKDFERPAYRKLLKNSSLTIPLSSRTSTGLDIITVKCWNSGG